MFFSFVLMLLAGAIIPVVLFSSVEVLGLGGLTPMSLASGQSRARRAAHGAWSVAQAYIWLGWAAYCATLGLGYALKPMSGSPWTYLSVSLFATAVPIAYLRLKDQLTSGSDDEQRHLQRGSNFWRVVVLSACVCFWIAPQLMSLPFGWLATVAPKVIAGSLHPQVDVEVGIAPSRTTVVAPSPWTPGRWRSAASASSAGSAGQRVGRSTVHAASPCGDAATAGHDGDGNEPVLVAGSQDVCAGSPTDGVGVNN